MRLDFVRTLPRKSRYGTTRTTRRTGRGGGYSWRQEAVLRIHFRLVCDRIDLHDADHSHSSVGRDRKPRRAWKRASSGFSTPKSVLFAARYSSVRIWILNRTTVFSGKPRSGFFLFSIFRPISVSRTTVRFQTGFSNVGNSIVRFRVVFASFPTGYTTVVFVRFRRPSSCTVVVYAPAEKVKKKCKRVNGLPC